MSSDTKYIRPSKDAVVLYPPAITALLAIVLTALI